MLSSLQPDDRLASYLRLFPSQGLERAVVLEDGELDGLAGRVKADGELRLVLRVGDADQVPTVAGIAVVPESRHEGKLLREALVERPATTKNGIFAGTFQSSEPIREDVKYSASHSI